MSARDFRRLLRLDECLQPVRAENSGSIRVVKWGRMAFVAATVLLLASGTGAGACKLALNCHLRTESFEDSISPGPRHALVPTGFREDTVVSGLRNPTSFDFLPGGGVLIAEKKGMLRIRRGGQMLEKPALDLLDRVDSTLLRGLVAVAVDPRFDENGFVYALFARKRSGDGPTNVELARYELIGDAVDPSSEKILIGSVVPKSGSCTDLPPATDCLPSDVDHIGGDIAFAADGTIFVSTGDGGGSEEVEAAAFRALDVDALGGKILHITRDGAGVPSNPFFDGNAHHNRSKVWAFGLRNPFRLTLTPGVELPVVGDVGWSSFDVITTAPRGANLGWPCFEGRSKTPVYKATPRCRKLYQEDVSLTFPDLAVAHGSFAALVGGAFSLGNTYPERFRSAYFFGDWERSVIRYVQYDDARRRLASTQSSFATKAGGPVQLRFGPDGLLYYLALNNGELRRVRFLGNP